MSDKPGLSGMLVFAILAAAALLEAGGDALVRSGLHASGTGNKVALILVGGGVLLAYGVVVNAPAWDFGRLLGIYVVLFFVVAQAINGLAFGILPSMPIFLGGILIVAGGAVMTFWH